jgi:hypothetical protein
VVVAVAAVAAPSASVVVKWMQMATKFPPNKQAVVAAGAVVVARAAAAARAVATEFESEYIISDFRLQISDFRLQTKIK